MYNDELEEEEQSEQTNGSFIKNFYYNNKVLVWIFLGIIIFILLMSLLTKGGSNKKKDDTKYELSISPPEEVTVVAIGKSTDLNATVTNAPTAEIIWSVEDSSIAKVDDGNVVGINYGKTKVTATYYPPEGDPIKDTRDIIVADGDVNVKVTDVSFKNGDLFMPVNATYEISLVIVPSNGFIENETFTSSKPSVVTVDNRGVVKSLSEGDAIISLNVNNQFRKELHVYVSRDFDQAEITVTPDNISFDGELRKIKVGTKEKLTYTVEPSNTDKDKLKWESSDESVVTVDESGYISALKEGSAVITLSSINGKKDKMDIEVESDVVPVTDIALSVSELYLMVEQSQTLIPTISPENASNKALSYTSLDNSIAVVTPSDTGTSATIKGISAGTTTIVIRSTNNVEKRLNVIVSSNSGNQGGDNGNGNGNGGGGGGSKKQGYSISSRDYYGEPYIVNDYSKAKPANNGATAPVAITITKTDSSITKLKAVRCYYSSIGSCNENSSPSYTITNSQTFTISTTGEYVIRVYEYDSNNNIVRNTDKFIWVRATSGSGTINSDRACSSITSASECRTANDTKTACDWVNGRCTIKACDKITDANNCTKGRSDCKWDYSYGCRSVSSVTPTPYNGVTPTPYNQITPTPYNQATPFITCKNPTYNGKEQTVATCSGGTFTSNGKTEYKATDAKWYPLECCNGSRCSNVSCQMKSATVCSQGQYLSGTRCVDCPKCNGNVTCFTSDKGATDAMQCYGTVPAGKYIECNSTGCTVSSCTGNTYSVSTKVGYTPSLKTTCQSCGSKTANSTHTGCVDSSGSGGSGGNTGTKSMSSLTYTCNRGVLTIKDGAVYLNWSDYCDRESLSSANNERYKYTCYDKPKSGRYTGTYTKTCSANY